MNLQNESLTDETRILGYFSVIPTVDILAMLHFHLAR